jgi:hypothetical protein
MARAIAYEVETEGNAHKSYEEPVHLHFIVVCFGLVGVSLFENESMG